MGMEHFTFGLLSFGRGISRTTLVLYAAKSKSYELSRDVDFHLSASTFISRVILFKFRTLGRSLFIPCRRFEEKNLNILSLFGRVTSFEETSLRMKRRHPHLFRILIKLSIPFACYE
jgi:hypothetical protein